MSLAVDIDKRIDLVSGTDVNYRVTNTWYDGSPVNDTKKDGVIYVKRADGTYLKKMIADDQIPKVDTIDKLRTFNGYFEGQSIILLGYYAPGDKQPLQYKFTVTNYDTHVDDGGYKIKTNKGTWIAQFNGRINALDFGIKADYDPATLTGTNNSPILNKMFAVPANIYEFPVGNILLSTPVKVPEGVLILGAGPYKTLLYDGVVVTPGTATGILYQLSSSDSEILKGATFQSLGFVGQVTSTNHNQGRHLLSCAGTKNFKVVDCHFWGFRGDGIYVSSGPANANRRRNINVKILNSYFNGVVQNNRNGISVIMADDITIDKCYFENIGAPGLTQSVGAIDVERNSITDQITSNVVITDCIFKDIQTTNTAGVALFGFGANVNNGIPSSKNHKISGNHFINCYWGVALPEQKLDISNNMTPTGVNITGNYFIDNVLAIQISGNSNVVIDSNHFTGSYDAGKYCNIELYTQSDLNRVNKNIKIINNHFFNTGRSASIHLTTTQGITIENNICTSNRAFILQQSDALSGNPLLRQLENIRIVNNKFEGIGSTSNLYLYSIASGDNNINQILVNSSCEFSGNQVSGTAIMTNMTKSAFNKQVFDKHITTDLLIGSWKVGNYVETNIDNYNYRIRCVKGGTSPFVSPITVSATNGSNILNVTSALSTSLRKGMFVLIGDDTNIKEVIDVYDDTVLLKTNYTGTTNTTASVVASPPQFVSEALTNYVRSTTTNTNLNLGKGEETIIFTGGGTGASIITSDINGFPNAIKRYRNNKTGNLTVSANTGVLLNGVDSGSVIVEPGKTLVIMSTAANTWVTIEYLNTATTTLVGGVKQSATVADVSTANSTQVSLADLVAISIADLVAMSTADVTTITTADATDAATTQALANEIKAKVNIIVAFINELKSKVNLNVTLTNDEKAKINSNVTFVNDIKSKYNAASTLSNSNKTQLNAKLAADRNSAQQAP